MNKIKETFSSMDKKLITYLLIALGFVIFIFVFFGIISIFKGKRLSFSKVEEKLKSAAVSFYKDYPGSLPQINGEEIIVDSSTLSGAKKMQELSKITPKGSICTGRVVIQKNGEFYLYTPYLDCGNDYITDSLYNKIMLDNPVVTQSDGLYQMGDDFVFRGEKVNNYVSFSGKIWRIMRIASDGSIKLLEDDIEYTGVWDDRYNIDRGSSTGINDFNKSRLKDGLEKIYNEMNLFNDDAKSKISLKNLCIGKRDIGATDNSGNIECSNIVENSPIGLMQVNEFMIASLDPNCLLATDAQCANYNYLSDYTKSTWTLTADSSNSYKAYKFVGDGFNSSMASNESGLRLVIYLSDNTIYSGGTGTLEDPYIVK